jgi:hypothetical protein
MDPVVNFELKNSVLTTTSHLVFSVTKGEIVIDNSLVNQGTSRQIENRSTMTIKNGSVVNGAVATSSNAINPGTIIVENATYAVTGEFSGAAEGTGTLVIKKGANASVGSIKAGANVTVDAEGMAAGDEINFEEIEDFITEFNKNYRVEALFYDPAFAQMMMQNLRNKGVNVQEFRQNGLNYTDVINSFELAVQTDKISFVENDCFKWNLYNVEIQSFNDGRLMPYKRGDENKKIDVAIACLMAYKGIVTKPEEEKRNSAEAYLVAKGYIKNEQGKWIKP